MKSTRGLKTKPIIFNRAIVEAQEHLKRSSEDEHDFGHARRVAANARWLGQVLDHPQLDLLEVCGWWHDVGRLIDPPRHEAISARMLRDCLQRLGADAALAQDAHEAIIAHGLDMHPQTLAGQIIRDSDKLEYIAIERWETCLNNSCPHRLATAARNYHKLPDQLQLQPAKELYKQRLPQFQRYQTTSPAAAGFLRPLHSPVTTPIRPAS